MDALPTNLEELRRRFRSGWRPKFVFFWSHEPARPSVLGSECFSQWYPAPFIIDGVSYPTSEHYMMWSKARLFRDEASAEAILTSRSPAAAKRLGRNVRGFVEEVWHEHRVAIVLLASVAKFSQNEDLRAYLLGTKVRVLAEASPLDRVWGIGREALDERATNPLMWRGLNLLGFALMQTRATLASVPPTDRGSRR